MPGRLARQPRETTAPARVKSADGIVAPKIQLKSNNFQSFEDKCDGGHSSPPCTHYINPVNPKGADWSVIVSTSPVAFPYPSPIATAVQAIKEANKDIAEVAQNVAENGAEGLAEDVVKLSMAETAVKANAAVVETAAEMLDEVIDILA